MILWLMVLRSLRQHALSTLATILSVALAGGLLMSVWSIKTQSESAFTQAGSGFDAVLGARGSKLQLVLNAIFHLEASPGNITEADYETIKRHPAVKLAIPIAVGDNLRGYRIVGTIPEMFSEVEYNAGRHFALRAGRIFQPTANEAVVGSFAAERLQVKIGDIFHPFHGLIYNEKDQHAETYVVVGVLAPSNTPADKVVWIPLLGLQTMAGHDPRAATEVSAVLIKLRSPSAGFMLNLAYNREGNRLTFAYPVGAIMADFFHKIDWFDHVLALVAYLVAFVSAIGVLAAIYNSMVSRRRDLAILRSLGAGRFLLFSSVILEASAIGFFGMVVAFGVYAIIVAVVASIVRTQTGVLIDPFAFDPVMVWAPLGMIALCSLCGIVPAWKAYRTAVAENLAPIA